MYEVPRVTLKLVGLRHRRRSLPYGMYGAPYTPGRAKKWKKKEEEEEEKKKWVRRSSCRAAYAQDGIAALQAVEREQYAQSDTEGFQMGKWAQDTVPSPR